MSKSFGLLFVLVTLSGCSGEWLSGRIEPHTTVKVKIPGVFSPEISFDDTKNNTIVVRDLEFNVDTKAFKLGELSILNDSSGVIASDAARMPLILEMQRRQFEHLDRVSDNITKIFERGMELGSSALPFLTPGASISGPLGGNISMSNAFLKAAVEEVLKRISSTQATTLPPDGPSK